MVPVSEGTLSDTRRLHILLRHNQAQCSNVPVGWSGRGYQRQAQRRVRIEAV